MCAVFKWIFLKAFKVVLGCHYIICGMFSRTLHPVPSCCNGETKSLKRSCFLLREIEIFDPKFSNTLLIVLENCYIFSTVENWFLFSDLKIRASNFMYNIFLQNDYFCVRFPNAIILLYLLHDSCHLLAPSADLIWESTFWIAK